MDIGNSTIQKAPGFVKNPDKLPGYAFWCQKSWLDAKPTQAPIRATVPPDDSRRTRRDRNLPHELGARAPDHGACAVVRANSCLSAAASGNGGAFVWLRFRGLGA